MKLIKGILFAFTLTIVGFGLTATTSTKAKCYGYCESLLNKPCYNDFMCGGSMCNLTCRKVSNYNPKGVCTF